MIDADDLRDALIYGIENAQRSIYDRARTAQHSTEKMSVDDARNIALALDIVSTALDEVLAKLTGDWPPTRG